MKTNRLLLLLTVLVAFTMQSCIKDKCQNQYTYLSYEPVYMTYAELRASVASEAPRALNNPGKIWFSGNYIFINEKEKGIHVINNSNPSSPINEAFINIPGNLDVAVRGNILFADNYVDLVAIDITTPTNVTVAKRIENALPQRGSGGFTTDVWGSQQVDPNGVITHYDQKQVTTDYESDCDGGGFGGGMMEDVAFGGDMVTAPNSFDGAKSLTATPTVGNRGGSMARFAMHQNYLYIVDNSTMHLYDIINPANITFSTQVQVGWDIETIFIQGNYIFLGGSTGMNIYDNNNPANPVHIATYSHVSSCDPVVVEGDYAYITLRSGTPCEGFTNQLDVVDISEITNPTLKASYTMTNPHGLGIESGILFICDGAAGLKVYDASNPLTIADHQLQSFPGIHAYDVIPFQQRLFMIGDNGFYQYDYSNPNNLVLLSTIAVQ
ncbi:hypothetical protein BH09BAC1_BH09BAC1_25870 [soil metagenome]